MMMQDFIKSMRNVGMADCSVLVSLFLVSIYLFSVPNKNGGDWLELHDNFLVEVIRRIASPDDFIASIRICCIWRGSNQEIY